MKLLLFIFAFGQVTFGQQYDWPSVFAAGNTMDQIAQQAARDRTQAIIDKLTSEDSSSVVQEIPGLASALESGDSLTRVGASGMLLTLSSFRSDSQSVLLAALPVLAKHMRDDDSKVSENCTFALTGLQPSIPPEVVKWLADLLYAPSTSLPPRNHLQKGRVIIGLQRVYGSDTVATNAIDQLIDGSDQKKLLFLRSFTNGVHPNPSVVAQLGRLLKDTNVNVAAASLDAIGHSGYPAIVALKPEILDIEEQSGSSALAQKAHELLEALSTQNQN